MFISYIITCQIFVLLFSSLKQTTQLDFYFQNKNSEIWQAQKVDTHLESISHQADAIGGSRVGAATDAQPRSNFFQFHSFRQRSCQGWRLNPPLGLASPRPNQEQITCTAGLLLVLGSDLI